MSEIKFVARFLGPSPYATEPVVVAEAPADGTALEAMAGRTAPIRSELGLPAFAGSEDPAEIVLQSVVDLALKLLNDPRGYIETGGVSLEDRPLMWLGYHQSNLSLETLNLCWRIFADPATGLKASYRGAMEELQRAYRKWHPDFQARILLRAAKAQGIPTLEVLPTDRVWQFGWGWNGELFFESESNLDGALAQRIAGTKSRTSAFLRGLGVPVPPFAVIARKPQVGPAIRRIGFPCVVKPQDRGGGRGVTAGIEDEPTLRRAIDVARAGTRQPIMIERHISGQAYRVMVTDGRCWAVIERRPAEVVGDGATSVAGLLEALNKDRSATMGEGNYLRQVALDSDALSVLERQGLCPASVPEAGQHVPLRSAANQGLGGTCHDATERAHPSIRAVCERIAATAGIRNCGVDLMTPDISLPLEEAGGAVIEINLTPGIGAMIAAGMNELEVGRTVLGTRPARIPVLLVVSEDPDALGITERFFGLRHRNGNRLALDGEVLDEHRRHSSVQDLPWESVRAALKDRLTERLVILASRENIERHGMPVDRVDMLICSAADLSPEWEDCLKAHAGSYVRQQESGEVADLVSGFLDRPH